jgi:hypothetical protein
MRRLKVRIWLLFVYDLYSLICFVEEGEGVEGEEEEHA